MRTVRVPEKFAPLFERAQKYVAEYFAQRRDDPERGTIDLGGQRYVLVRARSMSVEFFDMVRGLYPGDDDREALSMARSLLFDIAHAMGMADAKEFSGRMGLSDPLARLSAGPVHFAHAGWAFVALEEESSPTPDDEYYLVYEHPYSFESDSWLAAGRAADSPVCVMNAGYSSGWCEFSFGVTLVASEITCLAKGDSACRFIMAPPARIQARIDAYLERHPKVRAQVTYYEVPGFFARKKAEDALKASHRRLKQANEELERRVRERTRELEESHARLEQDIRERKRAEALLSESEELNRRVFEALPGGLVQIAKDGSLLHANAEACRILGLTYEELTQKYIQDFESVTLHADGTPAKVEEYPASLALATGEPQPGKEIGVQLANGQVSWSVYTAVPLKDEGGTTTGVVVTFFDITDRKRAEQERQRLEAKLLEVEKLESLGVLAGGIAHDFNNLLVGVLGNAGLAREICDPNSELEELLRAIEDAAERVQVLTKQMLAYSGKGHFKLERVKLSEEVRRMRELVCASLPKNVIVEYDLDRQLPSIDADAVQLQQLIMSLLTNAAESLEGQGKVYVRTGLVELTSDDLSRQVLGGIAGPGSYVYVEVQDHGAGMSEETKQKIFDPFFTTKFSGRGLGLAAALGIVRGHRGAIQTHSELGVGSRFRVLFPVASGVQHTLPGTPSQGPARHPSKVLVVDDDSRVRAVISRILQAAGLEPLTADCGRAGLDLYREHHSELSAVVLDLTMPDVGGADVFGEMRRLNSDVPVILTSGYSEQEATRRFAGQGLAGFLEKPFTPDQLRKIVTRAMDSAREPSAR